MRQRWAGVRRSDILVAVVLLAAVAFRIGLILALPGTYNGEPYRQDGYAYDSIAWNFLRGFGFAVNRTSTLVFGECPPCQPIYYPLPGYPLFLSVVYSIFGRSYVAVKVIQALL